MNSSGEGGITLTDTASSVLSVLRVSLREAVARADRAHPDESERIRELARHFASSHVDWAFKDNLTTSLHETDRCLAEGCYIAVLALCGKLLEITLRVVLLNAGHPAPDDAGLGNLLRRAAEAPHVHLDSALKNVANIIKLSRIPAVHAKDRVPVPSEGQALMVVRAVLDALQRLLLPLAEPLRGNA